ncbi:hypothetical protein [Polyangium spumosum]|uniref:Uncharacterized protein n=1 Tax=Polyangium spumosum TaxID=889282 RepID=A0A6N7Q588_9BACT|nr:hypothetical protein [Polyangium spumosum]MRG98040.1 hypothetical protein [Polyangium spumosum]
MGKGDHVFNNVVAKLTKAFDAGLAACFGSIKKPLRGESGERLARDANLRDAWMRRHMPRTWAALHHFKDHPELVILREKLQTTTYVGGDVNTRAYSEACVQFEEAVNLFFENLARGRAPLDANVMLPDIAAVRRAFFHMTQVAEDPGALARLLEHCKDNPRERKQVDAEIEQVRESMRWAWGRCEYLFRMVTQEMVQG